jgi:hypothetical protein
MLAELIDATGGVDTRVRQAEAMGVGQIQFSPAVEESTLGRLIEQLTTDCVPPCALPFAVSGPSG